MTIHHQRHIHHNHESIGFAEINPAILDYGLTDDHDHGARQRAPVEDSVQMYLREIGAVSLLTADEEVQFAKLIERAKESRSRLTQTSMLARAECATLERDVIAGDEARRLLIQANLRLVVSIAKKYANGPLSLMDLVQEGNIGLMRAVEKFDYTRGHRFSTYATWWIRQAITRTLADQGRLIRLPVHMSDTIGQLRRVARQLEQSLGRDPSVEELADASGLSLRKVRQLLLVSAQPISLEQPLGGEYEGVIGDVIPSESLDEPLDITAQHMLVHDITAALEELPERERRVLQLRYGLIDGRRRTLEEVGIAFGITRERTRQIEADALRYLRSPGVGARLQPYLD